MANKSEKKIKVHIWAHQQVSYSQTVEMTRAEYDELCERWANDPQFGKENCDEDLGGWIDLRDSDAAGDVEVLDISEVKPKKEKGVSA